MMAPTDTDKSRERTGDGVSRGSRTRRSIRWFKTGGRLPGPGPGDPRVVGTQRARAPATVAGDRGLPRRSSTTDPRHPARGGQLAGAHVQSPVWIYWYPHEEAAYPQEFATNTHLLCDSRPARAYGWSKERSTRRSSRPRKPRGQCSHQRDAARAAREASAMVAHAETVGACRWPAGRGETWPGTCLAHHQQGSTQES